MNRGVWIGGLFLSLCAWAGEAGAQQVLWRPTTRPADPQPSPYFQVAPNTGASLGRPLARAQAPAPPAVLSPNVVAASYHLTAAPRPVPRVWPEGLDGLDAPAAAPAAPAAPADAATGTGLFAADRGVRSAVFQQSEPIAVAPRPGPVSHGAAPPVVAASPVVAPPAALASDCLGGEEPSDPFPSGEDGAPRFYARGEYLLWWFKRDQTPPLITTSAPADNGFLNGATTQVLFGGALDNGSHSGARFTAGYWLDDCEHKAIEVSGFFLGGDQKQFEANSAFFPVIARPFFSINRNREFAQLTAFPGESTGNAQVRNSSNLWGVEANVRCNLCCDCLSCCEDDCMCGCDPWKYRVDALAGVRYLNLHEDLGITEHVVNLPTAPPDIANETAVVSDDFATRNQFYGGQVGLDGEISHGPWSLNVRGKVALGDTNQTIIINGSQVVMFPDARGTQTFVGGLLAERSNIGTFHKNAFSVVPEVNLTLSYHMNEHWRLFGGYDFLYWTNVVRPGEQIDRVIDETQIPNFDRPGTIAPAGQNRPAVLFRQSDFWAQGIHLGLEFKY